MHLKSRFWTGTASSSSNLARYCCGQKWVCSQQVAAQAHALILASGTLAPVSALTAQLFPGSEPAAIGRFACGHVVPREQLLALALGRRGSSWC